MRLPLFQSRLKTITNIIQWKYKEVKQKAGIFWKGNVVLSPFRLVSQPGVPEETGFFIYTGHLSRSGKKVHVSGKCPEGNTE